MKITRLIVLIQYLASVNCPSLFTGKTCLVITTLCTPHCPCPIADKSIQLCGTQRLGFSCRAKARVGRVGGGGQGQHGNFCCSCHSTDFRQIKTTATITPPNPPSSPPQPTWPVTSHHFYAGNAARSGAVGAVVWRRGCVCTGGHCWKRADSLDGISFDRQKYWQI